MRRGPHLPSFRPAMHTRRPRRFYGLESGNVASAVPVSAAAPLHDDGTVAHRHVRRLPERGTNVGCSVLRRRVAQLLFGAGPCPCQQPGHAERPAVHPVIGVVYVLQPDPSLTCSVFSVLAYEIPCSTVCLQSILLATSVLGRGLPTSAACASRGRTPR